MPISLITGPANAGKAQLVIDGVRAHLARGRQPLLVVPTRVDAEHYLRELAGQRALMGARVERFAGLLEEVVRRGGAGERALGALARERVLAAVVARRAPARATPGFARALAALVAELRVRRVSPERLRAALAQWEAVDGGQPAGRLVGQLYCDYEHALNELGRMDVEQIALAALDALRRRPALWGDTPVLLYGFDDFDRLQLDAIETLGAVVGASVTVSLTYEPGRAAFAGRAATFQALAPLAAEHTRLAPRVEHYAPAARAALSHLERSLFEDAAVRAGPGGAVRLLTGEDERHELELVAQEIGMLLADGVAAEQIAVVLRAGAETQELLAEVFDALEIPFSLQRRRRFADTAVGGALIALLRCAADGDGELEDLLSWLRAPGLLRRRELADALEAQARRAGITSALAARELWESRHFSLDAIDHVREAAERGPGALIERAARELQWLFCAPRRRLASVLGDEELDDARALGAGRRALGELGELARAAPQLAPGDAAQLARVLADVTLASGERPGIGKVAVLDPLALRARRVRMLFLCRLQEGVWPAHERARSLLGEQERDTLAQASGLRLGEHEDGLAAERYLLYAAVSRAQELLVLSWHTTDSAGVPQSRSQFADDVCELFEQEPAAERATVAAAAAPQGPARGAVRQLAPLRDRQLLDELKERTWSASSLGLWIACPVRWFVERMLRARDIEPEAAQMTRGSLAHAALKDTLEGLQARTGSARITPERLALARGLLKEALRRNERDSPMSEPAAYLPAQRRRLEADLERYLEHAAAAEAEHDDADALQPRHLELDFGLGTDAGLPALDLGDGLALQGRIDRVDVSAGGEAVVYDYKGASAPPAAKWIAEGSLQVALYMKAVEDLLGLRAAGGFYQPLRGQDLRARGVLDADSDVELQCVRTDRLPRAQVTALMDEVVGVARQAAAQAARGELEPRPQTCAFGGGCSYPTICRCQR